MRAYQGKYQGSLLLYCTVQAPADITHVTGNGRRHKDIVYITMIFFNI